MRACILKRDAALTVMDEFYRNSHNEPFAAGEAFAVEANDIGHSILLDKWGRYLFVPKDDFFDLFDCLKQTPMKGEWSLE